MTHRERRAAVHLVAAALLILAASCAREYEWERAGPPASRVEWHHVTTASMYAMCNQSPESYPTLGGCAFYAHNGGTCYVYSHFTEDQARRVMSGDGISLYDHEVGDRERPDRPFGHCNGWVHKNERPQR